MYSLSYCNVNVTVTTPFAADAWIRSGCENVLVNLRSLLVPAIAASYPSGRYVTGRECGYRCVAGSPAYRIAA
jgi:hypothetical protein